MKIEGGSRRRSEGEERKKGARTRMSAASPGRSSRCFGTAANQALLFSVVRGVYNFFHGLNWRSSAVGK